ncbi:MAG: hypothetical protein R6U15_01025 [Candidatus Izemoplasmatales bacterium]
MKNKKECVEFNIQDIWPLALVFVVTGIGVAFGLDVMTDVQDEFISGEVGCNATSTTGCGEAYNATGDAIDGTAKMVEKLPLIATVVVAAILIMILVRYLGQTTN